MKVGSSTPNGAGARIVAQPATIDAANGSATQDTSRSTPGGPTPPQTAARTATITLSGGSTPTTAPVTNAFVSGSSIAASAASLAAQLPNPVPDNVAVKATTNPLPTAQNTVLTALLALQGAHPVPGIPQAGAGATPAVSLPPNLLPLLKDTVKPALVSQAAQRSGEGQNAVPSAILRSPPSLLQRLLDVSSALKGTVSNPPGSLDGVKTLENLSARGRAS
ncbi:MAG: hypothetical protein GWP70_05290, partial [Proteobacteria bacterium]|nr:hypothetical protein [Pseudomonadota bacterium]